TFDSNAHEMCSYLSQGIYAPLLKRWAEYVPRERMLIVQSERYFAEPQVVADEVMRFLGLRMGPPPAPGQLNGGKSDSAISPATLQELRAFFAPHNEELFAWLGHRFDWGGPPVVSSRTGFARQTSRLSQSMTAPHPRS